MDSHSKTHLRPRGQRKTQDPCEGCFLHRDLCLCAEIPSLSLRTKVSLVIHNREVRRTTNTGILATKALANSEVLVRGRIGESLNLSSVLDPSFRTLLLYPAEDAQVLTSNFLEQSPLPIQLIVPDGNWRQASKVHYRHQELRDIPRVMVKAQAGGVHQRMRKENTEDGMATLEAIAYALGEIEGAAVQEKLLQLYHLKVSRTLKGRGIQTPTVRS